VLVCDNLNSHVKAAMAGLIAARPWLTVYRLPPYAHELNPVEPVWAQLKRSLANLAKDTIAELTALDRHDAAPTITEGARPGPGTGPWNRPLDATVGPALPTNKTP
jgi:hypothetical protein